MPTANPIPFDSKTTIIEEILQELNSLKEHESFPAHICAQAGRVSGAAGNLVNVCNNVKYRGEDKYEAYQSALSVAAQAIRFIQNLNH
ncbi:hypothetical protein ACX0G7_09850 [Flavitalea antarctica]